MRAFAGLFVLALLCSSYPGSAQMRQLYLDTDPDNHIYKISFVSPSEGYVAFEKWVGYTADSGRSFTQHKITITNVDYGPFTDINATFGFEINGVKAFDRNNLVVYGDYGLVPSILTSSDGGNTFKLVFHSQVDPTILNTGVLDMVFPQNGSTGFAVDGNRILKTTDKGTTWSISYFGGRPNHIDAPDVNNVFVTSSIPGIGGTLIKSTNGGSTWTFNALPTLSGPQVMSACFLNSVTGWISMQDGNSSRNIYRTIDGGSNWTLLNDPMATPFIFNKMYFLDANTGYALSEFFDVYKTTDGGEVWEPLQRDNSFTYLGYTNNDLFCWSASQVWAGGGHGFLEMTNNGGPTLPAPYFKIDTSGVFTSNKVSLTNFSKTGYQYRWFVNNTLVSTEYSPSYTHWIANPTDTIQLVTSSGGLTDTLTKYQNFFVPILPKISSFTPTTGSTGTYVMVSGTGFSNVTGASVGGVAATSVTVFSDTSVGVVLGAGQSGAVALSDVHGSYPFGSFTYSAPPTDAAPVIATLSPQAGPAGSTVIISGSGFGVAPAQNTVLFGSVPAVVQSASSTSIICTVPFGASYGAIHVTNRSNGLMGSSIVPFGVSFADSSNFTPSSFNFREPYQLPIGVVNPTSLYAEDLDGDGKPDAMVGLEFQAHNDLAIFRNTTTSGGVISFSSVIGTSAPRRMIGSTWQTGDLDGDGKPELVSDSGAHIYAYRNLSTPGTISFAPPLLFPTINHSYSKLLIADLDNDGRPDVADVCPDDSAVLVLRSTSTPGNISFGKALRLKNFNTPMGIAAGDLDGDGWNDIVTVDVAGPQSYVSIYHNISTKGNLSFASPIRTMVAGYALDEHVAKIVDYDGDGVLDVLVFTGQHMFLMRNVSTRGNISLMPPAEVPSPAWGNEATIANFSGGSRPDAFVANAGDRAPSLFKNYSRPGSFVTDSAFTFNAQPDFVEGADFDGDGKTDLFLDVSVNPAVNIMRNTTGVPVEFKICTDNFNGIDMASDITGPSYQWQQDSGTGFKPVVDGALLKGGGTKTLHFFNTPLSWNGYKYRCLVANKYSSTFVLKLTKTTHPQMSLTATDSVICYGQNVTFTTSIVDTAHNSIVGDYWQINGRDTGYTFFNTISSKTLRDKDKVWMILGFYDVCNQLHWDTTRAITMQVDEVSTGVQISVSDSIVCKGTAVNFTSTINNGGASPTYDWRVNGLSQGINSPTFSSAYLPDGSKVQLIMTSSVTCALPAYSNLIGMKVKDTVTPSVAIVASQINICKGTAVTFTANPVNKGTAPVYQWMLNNVVTGSNSATFSSAGLADGDHVQCYLVNTTTCSQQDTAMSNVVTIKVSDKPIPSVYLTASNSVVCTGDLVVFTAHPTNPGTMPIYKWMVDGYPVLASTDSTSSIVTIQRISGQATVTLISNAGCASPDTVISAPVSVTVNIKPILNLRGDTSTAPFVFHLTLYSQPPGLSYEWQDSTATGSWEDIEGAADSVLRYTPVSGSGGGIRCMVKSSDGCSTLSNTVRFHGSGAPAVNPPSGPTSPTGTSTTSTSISRQYPNPVTSTLTIENLNPSDPFEMVMLYNNLGNKVLTLIPPPLAKFPVALDQLNKGEYTVVIRSRSGKMSRFLILKL